MKGGQHGSMPPALDDEIARGAPEKRRKMEQVWHLLGRLEDDALNVPGTEEAWADLQTRLDPPAPPPQTARAPDRRPARHRARRMRWAGVPIAGLAVLLLGVWLWHQPTEVVVPPGAQRIVTLPDGSTAQLNSASRLHYRRGFHTWPFTPDAQRVVRLEGEAFFEVVHDPARPFVVETFNARVEVLGTQVNVRARQASWEDETRVMLASGRIRVTARQDPEHPVTLAEAGQTARIGPEAAPPDSAQVQPAAMQRLLVWREDGFSVVDKPLAFILAEVERRFAVSIDVEAGVVLTDSLNLFYPRGATAEQIIHDICLAQGYRYRQTSSGYAVFPADL